MSTVHVAVPVQDEAEHLPDCIEALRLQRGVSTVVWFCVNQPEAWQDDSDKRAVCEANRACLQLLRNIGDLDVVVLDRASPGRGWAPKRDGVGQARKELMDTICSRAEPEDLIVSLDADTLAPPHYLHSLVTAFAAHPNACAVAARYYHPVTDDDAVTRAMLGYEIYMRLYGLNLWRIGSPYSFTALGSALAVPVRVYRQVGGIPPRSGSEDFYFLQKLTKHGRVLHWSAAFVSPATRTSERVPVGTGQAILAAVRGEHPERYPLYPAERFDDVGRTTGRFAELFDRSLETPLDGFLRAQLRTGDPWQPLRENHTTVEAFVRACHERLDGLRILQYLKSEYRRAPSDDSASLRDWLRRHGTALPGAAAEADRWQAELGRRSLTELTTDELDRIRRMLFRMEDHYRRTDYLR